LIEPKAAVLVTSLLVQ